MTRADWAFLIVLAFVLSFCGVFGFSYVAGEGWPVLLPWAAWALTVLITPLIMIVFLLLNAVADFGIAKTLRTRVTSCAPESPSGLLQRISPAWTLKSILAFSAVMALLWLPWYIANFPGGTYWDTYYQIFQVYPENHPIAIIPWEEMYDRTLTDAWLVDHHPIMTTLIYGAFGWVSDQLTGNWMAGVAIFCALQGVAHVVAFTAACAYMRRVGCPCALVLAAYAFFALMPFVSTWAMCMVKDSMFGLFFIGYFMMLFECVRGRGQMFAPDNPHRIRNILLFTLAALGLCLTKKTGIFIVLFTTVCALMGKAYQNRASIRKAFATQALSCVLIACIILPGLIFPLINVIPGGKQETLGPMLQQTARYVLEYGDEVTPQERETIGRVINYSLLADEYAYDFEDSIKYRFNLLATEADLIEYYKVYVAQGLRHPDAYFAAIMSLAGFYVSPTAFINIRMVTVDTKMGDDQRYMLWNPKGALTEYRLALDRAYQRLGETPVVNLPLLIVTYVLWLPAFLLYMLWRYRSCRPAALMLAPFAVLLAFCVIAPVYDARYIVPVLDTVPLLFCATFICIIGNTEKTRTTPVQNLLTREEPQCQTLQYQTLTQPLTPPTTPPLTPPPR